MTWFWLNIPLGAVFFLAISAIPLWMVIRHPDDRPAGTDAAGTSATGRPGSVMAAGMTQWPGDPAETRHRRELASAPACYRGRPAALWPGAWAPRPAARTSRRETRELAHA